MKTLTYFLLMVILIFTINYCTKSDLHLQQGDIMKTWILTSIQNTKTYQLTNYPATAKTFDYIAFTDTALTFTDACGNSGQASYNYSNDSIKFYKFKILNLYYCNLYFWGDCLENNLDSAYVLNCTESTLTIYSKGSYNLIFRSKSSN